MTARDRAGDLESTCPYCGYQTPAGYVKAMASAEPCMCGNCHQVFMRAPAPDYRSLATVLAEALYAANGWHGWFLPVVQRKVTAALLAANVAGLLKEEADETLPRDDSTGAPAATESNHGQRRDQ